MDNPPAGDPYVDNQAKSWGPRPALLWTAAALAVAAAAAATWFTLSSDRPGALLFGVASVGLAVAAIHGGVVRPRLKADRAGVIVRTTGSALEASWPQVQVRVASTRRLGRDSQTLEIDIAGDEPRLIVFGQLELGADPADVLDDLNRVRAS